MDTKRKRIIFICVFILIAASAYKFFDLSKEIGWWQKEEKAMRKVISDLKSENNMLRDSNNEKAQKLYMYMQENDKLRNELAILKSKNKKSISAQEDFYRKHNTTTWRQQ